MRVFLSAFKSFSLAIPIDLVSSIAILQMYCEKPVEFNRENGNIYISLPLLLENPPEKTKHGIILKDKSGDFDTSLENKNILLTTEIECEANIPDEKINELPEVFKTFKFSLFFSGIIFDSFSERKNINSSNTKNDLMLLLNPMQYIQKIRKDFA